MKLTSGKPRAKDLPFVFINVAMTADGKLATENRVVYTPGSPRDQRHMMALRTEADAIIAGARTVDSQPVNMGPGGKKYRQRRLRNGLAEYNLRVIVSGSGTVDPNARIFQLRFSPVLVLTTGRIGAHRLHRLRQVADAVEMFGREEIDFEAALRWLRRRWNVQRLLCEGGGELNAALFQANLVDEIHVTICPRLFGGRDAPTLADGRGARRLAAANRFRVASRKRIGDELFLIFRRP